MLDVSDCRKADGDYLSWDGLETNVPEKYWLSRPLAGTCLKNMKKENKPLLPEIETWLSSRSASAAEAKGS